MATPAQSNVDSRLAKALSHPLRAKILAFLNERVGSPKEMADEWSEPLGNVSYHVRALVDLDCIELVRSVPRRGALQHYYTAIARPFGGGTQWMELPEPTRQAIAVTALAELHDELVAAVSAGSFDARVDRHLARLSVTLDDPAYAELQDVLAELFHAADRLQRESAERRAEAGQAVPIRSTLALVQFTVPAPAD